MSFNRATVSCPPHLDGWASSPYVTNQLNQVKSTFQLSEATYIPQKSRNNKHGKEFNGSFLFEGQSAAKIRGAKNFISMHMEQQMELMKRERGLRQAQAARDATLKEIEDGLRAEFDVPSDMIGLVIGKGGANVNSVKEQTGVERIVVDTDAGVVRIVGHAKEDVERAREMLEYAMEELALESDDVGSLLAPSQSGRSVVLNEIRDKAGLVRAQLTEDRSKLELIGTRTAVESAMLLVKTRLEYRKKITETQRETDSYYREAADIDYSYGYEQSYKYDDDFPAMGDGNNRRGGGKRGGRGGGNFSNRNNNNNNQDRRNNNRGNKNNDRRDKTRDNDRARGGNNRNGNDSRDGNKASKKVDRHKNNNNNNNNRNNVNDNKNRKSNNRNNERRNNGSSGMDNSSRNSNHDSSSSNNKKNSSNKNADEQNTRKNKSRQSNTSNNNKREQQKTKRNTPSKKKVEKMNDSTNKTKTRGPKAPSSEKKKDTRGPKPPPSNGSVSKKSDRGGNKDKKNATKSTPAKKNATTDKNNKGNNGGSKTVSVKKGPKPSAKKSATTKAESGKNNNTGKKSVSSKGEKKKNNANNKKKGATGTAKKNVTLAELRKQRNQKPTK
jgi:hypothetical protein